MSQIQQVKDATQIIEIIGERIELKRAGSAYRALCPFHSEKSPSFFVSENFGRYKCFGCQESGDVFNFLEKYEGMTFSEALKYLADRAGIKLENFVPTKEDSARERYLQILDLARAYYHYLLTKHKSGEVARSYLKKRQIGSQSIKLFQLGVALPAWDGLIKYLHDKKKFSFEDLLATGLIVKGRGGRYYDRFRDRIIFPLTNHRGQVVGFSGRLLSDQPKEAKYINTPATSLYHKSQMLYGFSELYQEIRKKNELIVVEGEFDVISSAQAHVNHVVAIKGSALTPDHLKLMGRVAQRIIFSLDSDQAGIEATKRAINLGRETNLELRVLSLEGGKDPDELAKRDPAAWRQVANSSVSIYDFLLNTTLKQFDPHSAEGQKRILRELAPILNSIPLRVEQDFYLKKLADLLQVKESSLRRDLEHLSLTKGKSLERSPAKPEPVVSRQDLLAEYLVFLLFHSLETDLAQRLSEIKNLVWKNPLLRELVTRLEHYQGKFDLSQFVSALPSDLAQALLEIYEKPAWALNFDQLNLTLEWATKLKEYQVLEIQDQLNDCQLKLAQKSGPEMEILAGIAKLQHRLKALNG